MKEECNPYFKLFEGEKVLKSDIENHNKNFKYTVDVQPNIIRQEVFNFDKEGAVIFDQLLWINERNRNY